MSQPLFSKTFRIGVLAVGLCVLGGCNTNEYKRFSDVKPGMEKADVLQQAGGPNVTRRSHGRDQWLYNYPSGPNGAQTKEVQFENGRAVYVGDKTKPKISAEEQDRLNDATNLEQAQRDAAEQARWNDEHGVANTLKTGNQLDRQDVLIQRSMYGTTPERERQFVAPKYQSVE